MPGLKNNLFRITYFDLKIRRGPPLDPLLIVYIKDRKNLKVNKSLNVEANTTLRPVSNAVLLPC